MPKRVRPKSRPKRWGEAVADAQLVIEQIEGLMEQLSGPLADIQGLREEYEEWYNNMPESFQSGATGEKLQAIVDMDFDADSSDFEDIKRMVEEAEGMDLPLGHGRD